MNSENYDENENYTNSNMGNYNLENYNTDNYITNRNINNRNIISNNYITNNTDNYINNIENYSNTNGINKNENYINNIINNNKNFRDDPFLIKHRKRTTKKQLEILEKNFEICIRPDAKMRKKLGDQLNMTPRAVQIWFQNRRAKIKKLNGDNKSKKKKSKSKKSNKETTSYYSEQYTTNNQYDTYDTYNNNQYDTYDISAYDRQYSGIYGEYENINQEYSYDISKMPYEGTYYQSMYGINKGYDMNQYESSDYYQNERYKSEMYGSMTNPYYYTSTTYNYTDEAENGEDYYYKMQPNTGYYYCEEKNKEKREDYVDRREE
ncbi:homeobox domain-containing protein 4 [Vairimorpha necatrix]|uniref:Homeobox domain-containing protein 4 n=1 Tax=Vairimorpha necatrix TaxID=6039 RepID=A0AAX4JF57_9MICR